MNKWVLTSCLMCTLLVSLGRQGGWREDLKHGLGRKIYANGDVYEGLWCNGKPDGPGR